VADSEEESVCKNCPEKEFVDGFCVDCWPGYDNCARPGCGHYRCEHIFAGTMMRVAYDKDDPQNVGQEFAPEVGCMVDDGCDHCPEFIEPELEARRG
jgi:hypothetical protein